MTLAEKESRLLPAADHEASDIVTRRLAADGVRIEMGLDLKQFSWDGSQVAADSARGPLDCPTFSWSRPAGAQRSRGCTRLKPVDHDERGIRVDQNLKTSQANIYAAGDVTGSFQLPHYAGWQGGFHSA